MQRRAAWKQEMARRYAVIQKTTPDERRAKYHVAFLAEEIARENNDRAVLRETRQRVAAATVEQFGREPESQISLRTEATGPKARSAAPLAIEADKLYSRQMLLALGMSRRMVNSFSYAAIRRGWYRGKDLLAALCVRKADAQRAKATRHPVQYRDTRRASNGR